ncbi:MAG: hypothetical protein PF569_03850 [Candidatus Woesearchaeota archaeon]|jgi:hypothetical protein|nr:hypothetical protein [Candidatus Woesearchaeota archaeon]
MNRHTKYSLEQFTKIDDVVNSSSGEEARDKANELASLWTNHSFTLPNELEFETIIKGGK